MKSKRSDSILSEVKKIAFTAIEQQLDELNHIGEDLWRFSEPPGKEFKSHDLIVDFLEKKGFTLKSHFAGFPTAFRAEYGIGEPGGGEHPNIGFLCQYDADELTGHSHGHNLNTVVALTAALGLQTVIKFATESLGMITVIGCPGHPDGIGKIMMLEAGCFKGIDFILTAYPTNFTMMNPRFMGAQTHRITFRGRARRDGGCPWEVANPVNATVLAYQNIAAIRQQFKYDWIVKGVITDGGKRPDVMPEKTTMEFLLKTPMPIEMKILGELLHRCFEAAATTSGCRFQIEPLLKEFLVNVCSSRLKELYENNAALMGYTFHNKREDLMPEDDISNVSTSIPTLKVFYYTATAAEVGTDEFCRFAGSKDCQFMSMLQGKVLAMMGIDLIVSEEKMREVFEEHQSDFILKYEGVGETAADTKLSEQQCAED